MELADVDVLIRNARAVYAAAESYDSLVMSRDDYRIMADALVQLREENARLKRDADGVTVFDLAAKLTRAEAEVARLKDQHKARSKIDPTTRLHNLCDHLAEQRRENPYNAESLELADAANVELQARIAALEGERDKWKTEAELRRERKIRCEELEAERDALRQKLDGILKAYDAYRGRGMLPAPNQYALLVAAIDAAREKP